MPTEEQAGVEPAHPLFRDSPVFETGALPFGHCSSAGIPSSFTPVRGDFTLDVHSAESLGFEPREPLTRFNGFQDRRIQPLCHDSAERTPHQAASSYYMRLSMCRQWGISRFPIFPPFGSVRLPGFEPGSRADYRDEDLNLARLPVPPQAH